MEGSFYVISRLISIFSFLLSSFFQSEEMCSTWQSVTAGSKSKYLVITELLESIDLHSFCKPDKAIGSSATGVAQ